MTDVRLILFGARFLDFTPVLSDESTGASLGMTLEWLVVDFVVKERIVKFGLYQYPTFAVVHLEMKVEPEW